MMHPMMPQPQSPEQGAGVIVSGASQGIGASIAGELARHGFTVGCLSRSGRLPTVDGHAASERLRLTPLRADVSDPPAVEACVAQFAETARLAGLVNCAGYHVEAPSADLDEATLLDVLRVNLVGAFTCSRAAYPLLRVGGGGLIVNIGSFYDMAGVPGSLAYSASKAALSSMTKTLAVEWARDDIRVVNVAPGYVATELNQDVRADPASKDRLVRKIPVRRFGEAHEVGRFVATMFSEPVGFLTGTTIYIDGGQSVRL
jgi:NAD(P)-dependent dehydrogenase (short-subunit alcohol dehydrogenase family)